MTKNSENENCIYGILFWLLQVALDGIYESQKEDYRKIEFGCNFLDVQIWWDDVFFVSEYKMMEIC